MPTVNRINWTNILLMLLSCWMAFYLPFHVFLFAYAFLGPLHYLTEISWLHDRNYFAQKKYDYLLLLLFCVLLTAHYFAFRYGHWPYGRSVQHTQSIILRWNLYEKLLAMALVISFVVAFIKKPYLRWGMMIVGFLLILFFLNKQSNKNDRFPLQYILLAFIPTLIHVYVFTGIFILYGAIKSASKTGFLSFFVFLICPVILVLLPVNIPLHWNAGVIERYGSAYSGDGFFSLSKHFLTKIMGYETTANTTSGAPASNATLSAQWESIVYYSKAGIIFVRFIAFAYLYHYLNWFSKTEVIQWHQIPRKRLYWIVGIWLASVALYWYDYSWGFQWLFFLSFTHVLLELPLNFVSIAGVFKSMVSPVFNSRFGNSVR